MTDILALMDVFERHEEAFRSSRLLHRKPAAWRTIACELVSKGESVTAVARRMGLSTKTVTRWAGHPLPAWRIAQQRRIEANDHVPPYVLRPRSWRAA